MNLILQETQKWVPLVARIHYRQEDRRNKKIQNLHFDKPFNSNCIIVYTAGLNKIV